MTVSSTSNKAGPYTGNNLTTEFPYNFTITNISEVKVYKTDINGNTTKLTTGYQVHPNNYSNLTAGGHVDYPYPTGTKLQAGEKLTLLREVPYTQLTDLKNQGRFNAEIFEQMVDRCTMMIQQISEIVVRAVVADVTQSSGAFTFPAPTPGMALGWGSGGALENLDNLGTVGLSAQINAILEADGLTVKKAASLISTVDQDIGDVNFRAKTLQSDVSPGTAPLVVASDTVIPNLNADKLDGKHWVLTSGSQSITYGSSYTVDLPTGYHGGFRIKVHCGLGYVYANYHPTDSYYEVYSIDAIGNSLKIYNKSGTNQIFTWYVYSWQ